VNSLVDNFATNSQMTSTFLFLDSFGLPSDYYNHRADHLLSISREEVERACTRIMHDQALLTVRIGRV